MGFFSLFFGIYRAILIIVTWDICQWFLLRRIFGPTPPHQLTGLRGASPMTKKSFLILLVVFLLGAFFRFYHLGEIPVGLHRDEAFLGYNAYSLLKTGRDMSGSFLPLHFESFIYSPAGYSYFSIPFIWFFSLSSFSVRFASAFFGSLTILVTYFLVKILFHLRGVHPATSEVSSPFGHLGGVAKRLPRGETITLLSALLLAISPWHINLSRTATENVIVTFFISLGVLLYLLFLKKDNWYLLFLSFFSFGITFLIYQAPRVFLPFFIPVLVAAFLKKRIKKRMAVTILLFLVIIVLPLLVVLSSKKLSLRIKTVSIFAGGQTQLVLDEQIRDDGSSGASLLETRIFHNKLIGYSSQFWENYFAHFSYNFLFTDQGNPDRYRIPLTGPLFLFDLPFLVLGLLMLLKDKRLAFLLIGWIFLAPVGSALAFDDVPNLQRTLFIFPVPSIITAMGVFYFLALFKKRFILRNLLILFLGLWLFYGFFFYLHQYYIHGPIYRPWLRQDGYRELVEKVNKLLPNYKKAVITDRDSAPTVFFLFFSQYDPLLFQEEAKKSRLRDFDRISFGKYLFTQEECPVRKEVGGEKGILYVNSGLCKSANNAQVLGTIKRGDNSSAFSLLTVNNE